MRCRSCAFENNDGMTFCGNCGTPLWAEPPPPPPPATPATPAATPPSAVVAAGSAARSTRRHWVIGIAIVVLTTVGGVAGYLTLDDWPGSEQSTTTTTTAAGPSAPIWPESTASAVLVEALGAVQGSDGLDLLDPGLDLSAGIAITMDDGSTVILGTGPISIIEPTDPQEPGPVRTPVSVLGTVSDDGQSFTPTPGLNQQGQDWVIAQLDDLEATANADGTWDLPDGTFRQLPTDGCGAGGWFDGLTAATAGALDGPTLTCAQTRTADSKGGWVPAGADDTIVLAHDLDLSPTYNIPVDGDNDGEPDGVLVCDETACVLMQSGETGSLEVSGGFDFPEAREPEFTPPSDAATADTSLSGFDAELVTKTVADETMLRAREQITQTWTIRNTGTAPWDTANRVRLVFVGGYDLGTTPTQIPITSTIDPGESFGFSTALTGPDAPGVYRGYWRLFRNSEPIGPLVWVDIGVGYTGSLELLSTDRNASGSISVPFEPNPGFSGSVAMTSQILDALPGPQATTGCSGPECYEVNYVLDVDIAYHKRPPPGSPTWDEPAAPCEPPSCVTVFPNIDPNMIISQSGPGSPDDGGSGWGWGGFDSMFSVFPTGPIAVPDIGGLPGIDIPLPDFPGVGSGGLDPTDIALQGLELMEDGSGYVWREALEPGWNWGSGTVDQMIDYTIERPECVLTWGTFCNPTTAFIISTGIEATLDTAAAILELGELICPFLGSNSTYSLSPGSGPYPQSGYSVPDDYVELLSLARAWMPKLQYSDREICGKILRVLAKVAPYLSDGTRITEPPFLADAEYVEIQYTIFYEVDAGRFGAKQHAGDNEGFVISLQRGASCRGHAYQLQGGYATGHKDAGLFIHVSESHLDMTGCPGGEYRVYVAEGKHTNYFSRSDCEHENLGSRIGPVHTSGEIGEVEVDLGSEQCEDGLLWPDRTYDVSGRVELWIEDPTLVCEDDEVAGARSYRGPAWPHPQQTYEQGEDWAPGVVWGDQKSYYCQARGRDLCVDPEDRYHFPGLSPALLLACDLVEVPDLRGMTEEEALVALEEVGLIAIAGSDLVLGDDIPWDSDLVDRVASQEPEAGTKIPATVPVHYHLGDGSAGTEIVSGTDPTTPTTTTTTLPPGVIVPDVVGMHWADAQHTLVSVGLIGSVNKWHWYVENRVDGKVRFQTPVDGLLVPPGTTIYLEAWKEAYDLTTCNLAGGTWDVGICPGNFECLRCWP